MGNPHRNFPSIHVAGTNGKGSTCRILATVLRGAGYKVGVYTSPHILDFRERFRIGDEYIPDEELIAFFQQYTKQIERHELTYFEITTAIAFWWFNRAEVDIALVEVGLGGRLDATNIVNPEVSVITSISLDHTDVLGDSIKEIAQEKAGIVKSEIPVVLGDLPREAQNKIIDIAEQKGASVHIIDGLTPTYLNPGRYQLTVDHKKLDIRTNMAIPIQAKNIAIAWQVLQQVQNEFPVTKEQFKNALRYVDLGFGRFEKLIDSQPWYFDGGHNLEAVKALKQSIQTVGSLENANLVLSMLKDKLRPDVMAEFLEFKKIYYYQLNLERAATFDDINNWLPQVNTFPDDLNQQSFLDDFDSKLVIFAGSFYFYEKVRGWVSSFALNN
jgi:dihydrofolate synthase/folylpolyglutamate synthase